MCKVNIKLTIKLSIIKMYIKKIYILKLILIPNGFQFDIIKKTLL